MSYMRGRPINLLVAGATPRQLARTFGVLSLINIVCGFFAIGYVSAVIGSPVTVHGIESNELLYRLGLAAHVIVTVTNVGLALTFYEIFKVVNRRLALLDVFLVLVATAVEASSILGDFIPLAILDSARNSSAFTPQQLQVLIAMPASLASDTYNVYTIFFGLDFMIPVAILTFSANFLPRAFGPLMAIDGLGYLINAFAGIVAPGFETHLIPWILAPILVSEGSLCLWFLIVGVDNARWQQVAARAVALTS